MKTTKKKTVYAFLNAYTQGRSGGDIAFIEIFKRIKGISLTIITSKLGENLCREQGLQANFLITTKEDRFSRIIQTYIKRIVKGLLLRIKVQEHDVLYATSDALPDTLPVFILKLKNRKVRWFQKVFHLIPRERFISHWSQKISLLLIKKMADVVVVDNLRLKTDLIRMGFSKNKLFVNHLGVDIDYFKKIVPSRIIYDGIFMARLHPSKGIFDLVEIWKKVTERLPKAKLAIIGQGKDKIVNKLLKEIKKAQLQNNINFLGYLENDRAFSLIKAAKAFVFPSHEEGFGIAIIEAIASKVPVVAYDLPTYPRIPQTIVRKAALYNTDQFAAIICSLLSDTQIEQFSTKQALSSIKQFTWGKIAPREFKVIFGP